MEWKVSVVVKDYTLPGEKMLEPFEILPNFL